MQSLPSNARTKEKRSEDGWQLLCQNFEVFLEKLLTWQSVVTEIRNYQMCTSGAFDVI